MELMRRVYRIFRKRLREDGSFNEAMERQIMRQFNTAIYEAQAELYAEMLGDSEVGDGR